MSIAKLFAPFNSKARQWTQGRKNWEALLKSNIDPENKYIWVHCASLGEFEQGRPLIEKLKNESPEYKVVLTFFSPSGYEIRKNYSFADYVCYLPADTPRNSRKFVSILNPALAIFVKYEFWYNYILRLDSAKIPLYLISGIFRPEQAFFRWYGVFFRKMLFRFTHIFVQDEKSEDLLKKAGLKNVSVAGDTRFDRVMQIAGSAKDIPQIDLFRNGEKVLLAGSSWPQDEEIIAGYINRYPENLKWIFAPHEIDKPNIDRLERLFSVRTVRFSAFTEESASARVMIIDNIGMLSSAYKYAFMAAIGGGFGKGIHNILEAACWGIPVVFGPNYRNFREANDLIRLNGARSYRNFGEFSRIVDSWIIDSGSYQAAARSAASYVKENAGSTAMIYNHIFQKDMNSKRS